LQADYRVDASDEPLAVKILHVGLDLKQLTVTAPALQPAARSKSRWRRSEMTLQLGAPGFPLVVRALCLKLSVLLMLVAVAC
jgi:hypothetical protein